MSTAPASMLKRAHHKPEDPAVISALPFLRRDTDSIWARAAEQRDAMYADVESTCQELKIDALVNKSIDFVYPAWVSLEAWLPAGALGATHRTFCTFSIQPKPYARFEFEVTIKYTADGKQKTYGPCMPPPKLDVVHWVRHVLDGAPMPRLPRLRNPNIAWQFWYPKNEVIRLGRDVVGTAGIVAFLAGLMLLASQPVLGFLGIAGGLVCIVVGHRRRRVSVNVGRPLAEPRTLRLVDSWQTVANGLGRQWDQVRERIFQQLGEGIAFEIRSRLETISYLTPDGRQERQQLVLSQGRGIVFCHVYPYGDDLFVGWEAYLNYGQWVESAVATGYDRTLKAPAVIKTVTPGTARATEYDLIDLNSLTEWSHSRIVQVVKRVMAERQLDQDIDFKIVRGERQSLLNKQEQEKRKRLFTR